MKSFIFVATMLVFPFLAPIPAQSMGQEATDAKALFEKKCGACHSTNRPKSLNKTSEEWTTTVTRMKGKATNISSAEVEIIIGFLTKTYGK